MFVACCVQEKYLHERIKVEGKLNNFGSVVALERNKSKVTLTADVAFSKRSVLVIFGGFIILFFDSLI